MKVNLEKVDDKVSCQVLEAMFIACDQKKIDVDWLLETTSYDRAFISKRTNYIDWSSLVEITNRGASRLTEQEILDLAEGSYKYPVYKIWRLMGLLRFDLFGFYSYLFGAQGPIAQFYPIRVETLESELTLRKLIVQYVVPEELEPCETLFKVIEGQAIGISKFLGYDRTNVIATYSERKVVLDFRLPQETGLWPRIRRALVFPFIWRKSISALRETQETLIQLQNELSEESRQLTQEREHSRLVEKQLNLVMGNQAVMLWTMSMELNLIYVSESVRTLLGYTVDEYIALPSLNAVAEQSQEAVLNMFTKQLTLEANGKPAMGTISIRVLRLRKDGSTFWSENYVSFLRDENGIAQGIVGFTVDVSDIIHQEARGELLEQQVQTLRQKEIVSLVAGGIAHDFNNSLQAIMGFAELVLDQAANHALPNDVVELQNQILKSAGSAADLVKKLLALSSQQTLSRKRVDVKVWLEDCLPMAKSILGKDIDLQIVAEASNHIYADPLQLERALINLMVNAKDAMEGSGTLVIRSRIVEEGAAAFEQLIELSVEDTGTGIAESDLVRIFDPFFSLKASEKGTGLGLAVTAGIVDQHEGHIRATNLDSGGTAFRMYFPQYQGQKMNGNVQETNFSFQQIRVLLVDDEDNVRELCRSFLEGEGAIVTEANSGASAVDHAASQAFDLIVMDVLMPGLNGNVAAHRIREKRPDQPILFITGYAGSKEVVDDLATETVLPKPFRKADLIKAVQLVMKRKLTAP